MTPDGLEAHLIGMAVANLGFLLLPEEEARNFRINPVRKTCRRSIIPLSEAFKETFMPVISTPRWMEELYQPVNRLSSPYIQNLYGTRAVERGNRMGQAGQNLPQTSYAPPTFTPPSQQQTTTATMPMQPQPTQSQTGLGDAVSENLASIPDLERLSQMVNQINQEANLARVPGAAGMEEQASQNTQLALTGEPPKWWRDQLATTAAERGAAGGFGVDSPNTEAFQWPLLFNKSLEMMDRGQRDLTSAYQRAAPIWSVSEMLMTPELLQKKEEFAAEMGFKYAQLDQDQKQFVDKQAQDWAQYANSFGEEVRQFNITSRFNQEKLAREMGLQWAELQAKIDAAIRGDRNAQAEMAYNLESARQRIELAERGQDLDYSLGSTREGNRMIEYANEQPGQLSAPPRSPYVPSEPDFGPPITAPTVWG
jgi:hypothetical protein